MVTVIDSSGIQFPVSRALASNSKETLPYLYKMRVVLCHDFFNIVSRFLLATCPNTFYNFNIVSRLDRFEIDIVVSFPMTFLV